MERRDFIRNMALAAGAATLSPSTIIASSSTETEALAKEPFIPAPFRKSIMFGTINMKDASVLEKCMAVKAAGFDGIEPNSHMDREEVLDAMAQTGLVASSVCNSKHWNLLLSSPDAKVRNEGIDAQIHAMEDAAAYGTDSVLLVPGKVLKEVSYEDCWNRATECIKELIPVAKDLKVNICIENVWNNFLLSPIEARIFVDQFKSKYVGFYFDCGNVMKFGWPEQWISCLGSRIKRVHIKEFSKTLEDSRGRGKGFGVKLTEGEVDWKEVIDLLRNNYSGGWLTTEQGPAGSPEELSDLCARLDKIISL